MDQYLDNRQKQILWDLLANPADTGLLYKQSLERLVKDNPQSGLLQVLLARVSDTSQVNRAAVYYHSGLLYRVINHPDDLALVDDSQVVITAKGSNSDIPSETGTSTDTFADTEGNLHPIQEVPEYVATEITEQEYEAITVENAVSEQGSIADFPFEPVTEDRYEETLPNNYAGEADTETVIASETVTGDSVTFIGQDNQHEETPSQFLEQGIDDEVYEEIVGIEDIGFNTVNPPAQSEEFETEPVEQEGHFFQFHEPQPADDEAEEHPVRSINNEEERLILGGIVSADYLMFDKKLDELRNTNQHETAESGINKPVQEDAEPVTETKDISRYNDDKLPYSFLWWLDKTRREHTVVLQPYANNNAAVFNQPVAGTAQVQTKPGAADELQQQYYENIFSLIPVSGIEKDAEPAKVAFDHTKKEDVIIERFIHTEPQIKPLPADKLDNENKARKSSEDANELVTETLARIYADQMLYHKAIATYKKLILKYPEKNLYFAARIEELEKRTN